MQTAEKQQKSVSVEVCAVLQEERLQPLSLLLLNKTIQFKPKKNKKNAVWKNTYTTDFFLFVLLFNSPLPGSFELLIRVR